MNDYCYKPKTSSLPKLNLTTLTTKYNSFNSNRSKSKSTSSNYNTFRAYNTNQNTSINFHSNKNENDKIYSLTSRKIFDDKLTKKKKKKIKSNALYLTEIAKNLTDDNYFAMA